MVRLLVPSDTPEPIAAYLYFGFVDIERLQTLAHRGRLEGTNASMQIPLEGLDILVGGTIGSNELLKITEGLTGKNTLGHNRRRWAPHNALHPTALHSEASRVSCFLTHPG